MDKFELIERHPDTLTKEEKKFLISEIESEINTYKKKNDVANTIILIQILLFILSIRFFDGSVTSYIVPVVILGIIARFSYLSYKTIVSKDVENLLNELKNS